MQTISFLCSSEIITFRYTPRMSLCLFSKGAVCIMFRPRATILFVVETRRQTDSHTKKNYKEDEGQNHARLGVVYIEASCFGLLSPSVRVLFLVTYLFRKRFAGDWKIRDKKKFCWTETMSYSSKQNLCCYRCQLTVSLCKYLKFHFNRYMMTCVVEM
jgi:hypothetical protein